jgi:hypothetical protein
MTRRYRILLIVFVTLIAASIYPGIPAGVHIVTNSNQTEAWSRITCHSLHWNGLHSKTFVTHYNPTRTINVNSDVCWSYY